MDAQHEVSRFGHVELADMPDDLRDGSASIAEKSGFVPNVFRALARRPRELRAFLDYHDALMDSDDGLCKAERELVVVATSGANHCTYCVVAHGAILRVRTKDPEIADRVATNPYGASSRRASGRSSTSRCWSPSTRPRSPTPSWTTRGRRASPTTRSGTSARSPRCSRCPTGWRTSRRCGPTRSST